ncbi:response regulator transcription factor [Agromyces protaetiae]|uniref:Response regulator transcription factor n=1 Tax=Agromyces protaetiae TaxID=2509455 RepID=A0A4P6FB97_9MICO|nr:response regulator transcription factor [Agromyces protaetiae]QAY73005.1 response regulator transcription factor [Agromyces protaetiae]
MNEPIAVAIVDDHALFCAGIRMIVESQPDLAVAWSATDGLRAVELAAADPPDVILMDIRMPGTDGITATRLILASARGATSAAPRVIVLTTHRSDSAVVQAIDAGAAGFIMKDAEPELLLAAIRTVHAGTSVFAPATSVRLVHDLAPHTGRPDRSAIEPLSRREREVYLLAARGLSNAEIAEAVFLGESTVKSHVSSILAKLGLASRLQVIAHAYDHGLVQ